MDSKNLDYGRNLYELVKTHKLNALFSTKIYTAKKATG